MPLRLPESPAHWFRLHISRFSPAALDEGSMSLSLHSCTKPPKSAISNRNNVPLTEGDSLGAKRQAGGHAGRNVRRLPRPAATWLVLDPLRELCSRCPPLQGGQSLAQCFCRFGQLCSVRGTMLSPASLHLHFQKSFLVSRSISRTASRSAGVIRLSTSRIRA